MFFAIVFIAIGLAILLNTMGIINGTFWGFFWSIFFLAVGIKMLAKQNGCPMCGWKKWHGSMEGKCCDGDHDSQDHH